MKHCSIDNKSYAWLQARIDDLTSDYKGRLAGQIPPVRSKRDLLGNIAGLFGSVNSIAYTYKINSQSQFSTWLSNHWFPTHHKYHESGQIRGTGASTDPSCIVQSDPYHRA